MKFNLSRHAQKEMRRRSISSALLQSVLETPQQIVPQAGNKRVYQSQLDFGGGRVFLLRAVVDDASDPATVITVYRTSKIAKYWRNSP